jgi:hypothetical protein
MAINTGKWQKREGYVFQILFTFDFILLLFIVILSLSRQVSLQEIELTKITHILTTIGTINFGS